MKATQHDGEISERGKPSKWRLIASALVNGKTYRDIDLSVHHQKIVDAEKQVVELARILEIRKAVFKAAERGLEDAHNHYSQGSAQYAAALQQYHTLSNAYTAADHHFGLAGQAVVKAKMGLEDAKLVFQQHVTPQSAAGRVAKALKVIEIEAKNQEPKKGFFTELKESAIVGWNQLKDTAISVIRTKVQPTAAMPGHAPVAGQQLVAHNGAQFVQYRAEAPNHVADYRRGGANAAAQVAHTPLPSSPYAATPQTPISGIKRVTGGDGRAFTQYVAEAPAVAPPPVARDSAPTVPGIKRAANVRAA